MGIVFFLELIYFGQGVLKFFTWDDTWWRLDSALKAAHGAWHIFLFTLIYVLTWLAFERRHVEGYIFSFFSFVVGLFYLLLPVDLVPEAIPVVGAWDDAIAVILTTLISFRSFVTTRDRRAEAEKVQALLAEGRGEEALRQYLEAEGITYTKPNPRANKAALTNP